MKLNEHIILRTQEFFESRYGKRPAEHEAREIVENITSFFNLLTEWAIKEKQSSIPQEGDGRDDKPRDSA